MEPARKLDQPHSWKSPAYGEDPSYGESEPDFGPSRREIPEWETRLGKIIFYLTVALGVWFFYWLNGIQCPC